MNCEIRAMLTHLDPDAMRRELGGRIRKGA